MKQIVCSLLFLISLSVIAGFFLDRTVSSQVPRDPAAKSSPAIRPNTVLATDYRALLLTNSFRISSKARDLYLSPDGRVLLINGFSPSNADSGCELIYWSARTGKKVLKESEGYVFFVNFLEDRRTVVTAQGYGFGSLTLWDWRTGKPIRNLTSDNNEEEVRGITVSPDGRKIAANSNTPWNGSTEPPANKKSQVKVWNILTRNLIQTLYVSEEGQGTLQFSPDGKVLASANDYEVKLWDTQTWAEKRTLRASSERIDSLAFASNGRFLATVANNGVRLWDTDTWKVTRLFTGQIGKPDSAEFSPDGMSLVSTNSSWTENFSSREQEFNLWNTQTGALWLRLTLDSNTRISYAFSPDSRILATVSYVERDDTIVKSEVQLWDVSSGKLQLTLDEKSGQRYATNVGFSPDGRTLVTTGYQQYLDLGGEKPKALGEELKLWDAESGKLIRAFPGMGTFAFSKDGTVLATGNEDGEVKLWSVKGSVGPKK